MAPHSPGEGRGPVLKGILFSLPRIIAKPISAIFTIYFPDLFIHTFEWKPGDFGLVTSIHSLARAISYLLLGIIFKFAIDHNKSDNTNKKKLDNTNAITVASILLYTVLPIYWTGGNVHTLYTLSRLKTLSRFNHLETLLSKIFPEIGVVRPSIEPKPPPSYIRCFNSPICNFISRVIAYSVPFIKSRLFVAIFIGILHAIGLSSYELCNRALPTYIEKDDKRLKTMTGINLGAYAGTFLVAVLAIASVKHFYGHLITDAELFLILGLFFFILQVPILIAFYSTIKEEQGVDPVAPSERANSQAHGAAQKQVQEKSCCCCKPDGKCAEKCPCCKVVGQVVAFIRRRTHCVVLSKNSPALLARKVRVVIVLRVSNATLSLLKKCSCRNDKQPSPSPAASQQQISRKCESTWGDWCQLISMIVLHGSINFWMTASAPAVEYVCTHIIIGNEPLRNFGPLVLLLCATIASVIYTVCNEFIGEKRSGSDSKGSEASALASTGEQQCGCSCSTCTGSSGRSLAAEGQNDKDKKEESLNWGDVFLTIFTILGQSFIYILLYKYDYWWNKGNWLHFLLIGLSGVACGLFMLNINNLQNSVVKKECFKDWKWVIIGTLFSFMYLTTAVGIYLMYKVYDAPNVVNHRFACIEWTYSYDFTNVFRIITIFYQILNAVAAIVYFVPAALEANNKKK